MYIKIWQFVANCKLARHCVPAYSCHIKPVSALPHNVVVTPANTTVINTGLSHRVFILASATLKRMRCSHCSCYYSVHATSCLLMNCTGNFCVFFLQTHDIIDVPWLLSCRMWIIHTRVTHMECLLSLNCLGCVDCPHVYS